jgi:rhodanese-related sulfurtransferase
MNIFKILKSLFTSAPRLAPADCARRIRAGEALLVDVREPGEWAGGVAQSAHLLSLSDLTGARVAWTPFLAEAKGREILVYCAAGGRSGIAARLLTAEGVRAANTGGLGDWRKAGWPVGAPARSKPKAN